MRAPGAALLLVGLAVAGCKDPAPPNGAVLCGPGGTCPTGYSCADLPAGARACYRSGELPDLGVTVTDMTLVDLARPPDLSTPAPPDGNDPCDDYCSCMEMACNHVDLGFPTEPACYAACRLFTTSQRNCRIDHCRYARDGLPPDGPDPRKHCPHANGVFLCVN